MITLVSYLAVENANCVTSVANFETLGRLNIMFKMN